jgi:plasmid stability protein
MASITVKNIPDDLYTQLKARAQAHRRSVNGELIHCLETVLRPTKLSAEERLRRFRSVRPKIDAQAVSDEEIRQAIDEGRP